MLLYRAFYTSYTIEQIPLASERSRTCYKKNDDVEVFLVYPERKKEKKLERAQIDRWLVGEIWNNRMVTTLDVLCDSICNVLGELRRGNSY